MNETAEIGVFGGSGFEQLLDDAESVELETPYGPPSGPISIGMLYGCRIAFLARHGRHHQFPPHRVPYRANVWAMKRLGVSRILSPCAVGSLQRHVEPGSFVVADQIVDMTKQRRDTFFDGPETVHVSFTDPYCPTLRPLAIKACIANGVDVHETGTVVVIEGPRFATRAESASFTDRGWEVINMTQHPEAALAREMEMCFVNISLITDYDAGFHFDSGIAAVSVDQILEVFRLNNRRLVDVLGALVESIAASDVGSCNCSTALNGARVTGAGGR